MKRIIQGLGITVFLLIFSVLLNTVFAAQTTEPGLIDKSANMPSTMSRQVSDGITNTGNTYVNEESAFHRFFKRAKDNLSVLGQRLIYVFSNYSKAPSDIVKALNHLSDGKGIGQL